MQRIRALGGGHSVLIRIYFRRELWSLTFSKQKHLRINFTTVIAFKNSTIFAGYEKGDRITEAFSSAVGHTIAILLGGVDPIEKSMGEG